MARVRTMIVQGRSVMQIPHPKFMGDNNKVLAVGSLSLAGLVRVQQSRH